MSDERASDLINQIELQMQFTQFAMDNASIEIFWLDKDAHIYYANNHACKTLGYTKKELLELSLADVDPNYPIDRWQDHWQRLKQDKTQSFETLHKRKDGVIFPVEVVANYVCIGGHEFNVGFAKDITANKQAELIQNRLDRTVKLLSKCGSVLVHAEKEQELLAEICKLVVETGGYRMAWIGFAEQDAAKTVRPVAQFGYEEGYLDNVNVTWADSERGRGPTGCAIRTGVTSVTQDFLNNPNMAPWREAALKRGYKSSIALPLCINKMTLGALTIYSSEPFAFGKEEVDLLEQLANDLAFGIQTLRTHAEYKIVQIFLQRECEKNRALLRNASDGIHILNTQGDVIEASDSFCNMLGYQRDELIGMNISQWEAKFTEEERIQIFRQQFSEKSRSQFETSHRRKDDTILDVEISGLPFELNGKPVLFNSSRDITERKKLEQASRIAAIAFETHEGIMITDANGNIIRVNQAFHDITGYTSEEVLGKNPRILKSGRQDKEFYVAMWQQLLNTGTWSGEIWDKRKSGQVYPKWLTITAVKDKSGKTTEYVSIFSDITARKAAEDEIHSLAFYDTLTGLPNRRLLLDRVNQALSVSARSNYYGAILFLDMDRFKTLNDTMGHDHGDLLLIEVARRILCCVREVDTVARLGGDEFVILIEEISAAAEDVSQRVAMIAEKIRNALTAPYQLNNHEYHSSPSIGVCLYHGNDESVETVLKHADLAMYKAKDSGRNTVRFFDPSMQQAVETHAAIEADLRHAVPDKQLRLHYQIQLDNDRRPLGAEALVRWSHPIRGMVPPSQFIPIAEESSLILEAGHWVLETACQQLLQWSRHEQTRELELAINVSAQQFRKHDFVEEVALAVRLHQVNPARLKLELTEGVVLTDVADVVAKMHALKALGIKLSLDDFGTGYSSLSYLKQLPLDQIKIDQSFVHDITTDLNDAVMVQTIIGLAQNFRLNVIAEGVETEAQLNFLKQNGCMAYQGYLFGKPVPIEQFEALFNQNR